MKAPYDGRFKILAEEYPHLLLRLLGIAGPGVKTQHIDILRELHLDPVQVDHVYQMGGDEPYIVHFEAITSWRTERIPRLALYHFLLTQKYSTYPVTSYAVLMSEKYAPEMLPAKVFYEKDGLRIEVPYEVIRLWEIDPAIAFEPGCEPLLPWVPLLRGGAAEFERASAAIEGLLDRKETPYDGDVMVGNLATLAALRYDKDAISHFLERLVPKRMLSTDLFLETWLYKDGVAAGKAEGKVEGKAEGKAEGQLEGKRTTLRLLLEKKFPGLGTLSEIDQISRVEALDDVLLAIFDAHNPDDARAAILAALRVN